MATIKFDYDSINNRILENLQTKSEWADFLINDAVSQELAYEVQGKEYYTTENWWSKARNKSSLLVESPVHGYIVPRKIGSTGTLIVSTSENFDTAYSKNVYITQYFEFSNGELYFISPEIVTLTTTTGNVSFTGVQGEAKSSIFTAEGNPWESYNIQDDSVENTYFTLYVNDVEWTNVDTLFDYDGDSTVYEIQTAPSLEYVTLQFGNGSFGKQLSQGDIVKFYYVSTEGASGDVSGTNNITTVESQAYDESGDPVTIYVKNTTAFLGGKDYPTLEEIRSLSPRVYQTGDRGTSRSDYQTLIEQLGYITKINIWGVYEYCQDNSLNPWTFIDTEENVVHIAALNNSYENLSDSEKTELIEDIYSNCDPTDIYQFSTVVIIYLIFNVNATVKNSSYILSDVKANILETITDNYSIENTEFNQTDNTNGNIYYSDFVSLIDSTTGVLHHTSSIQSRYNSTFSSAYYSTDNLPLYPIDTSSVEVYVKLTSEDTWTLIATGDSNGSINGETGYNTLGSTITSSTGAIVLVVNSGLTDTYSNYEIKYVYSCSNKDLILNQRYYIFAYDNANITVSYP